MNKKCLTYIEVNERDMSDLHFKLMNKKCLTYIEVNEQKMSDLHWG